MKRKERDVRDAQVKRKKKKKETDEITHPFMKAILPPCTINVQKNIKNRKCANI